MNITEPMNTPLRDLIAAEPDVRAVLELEPIAGSADWRYLIETPFATYPRFVIGRVSETGEPLAIYHYSARIETARERWNKTA